MTTLHVQDKSGDTQYNLDTDEAKSVFVKAMLAGSMAFMVTDDGNEQIFELPEKTKRVKSVIVIPQYVGG